MAEELFKAALASLSKKGVTHIECTGLELNDYRLELLITALEHSPANPTSIDVSNNNITSAGVAALARYLATASVQTVNLRNNQIDEDGALVFLSLFERETSIRLLDLRNNTCSVATASRLYYLSKSEKYPSTVRAALLTGKAVHISFTGMGYIDVEKELLRYLLLHVEGLDSVDFSGVDLGVAGMVLAGTLVKETHVSALSFRSCALTNDAVLTFVESANLVDHETLHSLDFSSNMGLTNDLVRKLISSLFDRNNRITTLNLTDTSITSTYRGLAQKECEINTEHPAIKRAVVALRGSTEDAHEINLQWDAPLPTCMNYLADFIAASPVIQRLNVSNTLLDDAGLELLSAAIQKNSSLKTVEVANCRITAAGVQALFTVLQKGKCAVEEVNVANNNLGEDSVRFITVALRANPKLTTVNVDVNPDISAASIQEIAGLAMVNRAPARIRTALPAIESNGRDVASLDFSGNDVSVNDDSVWLLTQALRLNSTVRRLNLSHNPLGDAAASYLADFLAINNTLQELDLSSCAVGNRGAQSLCEALSTNHTLRTIDLSDNMMDASGLATLPLVLRENNSLREFKLHRTRTSPGLVERVNMACSLNRECTAVKAVYYRLVDGDASLTKIDLAHPDDERAVDDQSVRTICSVLRGRTFVEAIDLSGNRIGTEGCTALAATLAEGTCNVRKVILSKNPIDDYAVAELVTCFSANETLREVILYDTSITDTGVEILAKSLEKNSGIVWVGVSDDDAVGAPAALLKRNLALNNGPLALKRLLLSIDGGDAVEEVNLSRPVDSSIDDTLCQILCSNLVRCPALRSLNLAHNEITSASIPYIVEVVELCPSLRFVDLSYNNLDERGAAQIIACVEQVSHVQSVLVTGNPLTTESLERVSYLVGLNLGSEVLKKLLLSTARNETLPCEINLNGVTNSYQLTDDEVVVLAGLLQDSSTVRTLDLGNNRFSDEGCIAIAEVLRVNHTLEALNLAGNAIGANGGEALYFALKVNPQLQHLGLGDTVIPRDVMDDIVGLLHVNQTPHRALVDMRGVRLQDVNDAIQFHSTDYYVAQAGTLENEAIEGCKRPELQLIEQKM